MKIIDMNGKEIVIEDLDTAIAIAEEYILYHSDNEELSAMHERLHQYWTDIYEKLNALK